MLHPTNYRDKKVIVLGMAKSGTAVAKLFHAYGAKVIVNDRQERADCVQADELEELGIQVICGHHPDDLIDQNVSLVVKNPGIPYHVEPIQEAQNKGIEVVTEVEVASFLCATKNTIGITGSNGKTTTTSWIGKLLEASGRSTIVAGNIGRALSDVATDLNAEDWLVLELSSFQLMGTQQFAPHIAVLLNFAETHLDYHGTMTEYVAAKAKIFAAQTIRDFAIMNWDDELVKSLSPQVQAQIIPFSSKQKLSQGVYIENHQIVANWPGFGIIEIIETSELGIPGHHNVENALAVCAVALAAQVPLTSIREVLHQFRGVEHRLEWVRTHGDIQYYNDSKATNTQSTIKAIDGFAGNVILIAGGLDRGSDYLELTSLFREKCKAVIALGETKEKLKKVAEQAGVAHVITIDEHADANLALHKAVQFANRLAESGDTILLSPACASWDMFPSYEVRGRIFKEAVHNLL